LYHYAEAVLIPFRPFVEAKAAAAAAAASGDVVCMDVAAVEGAGGGGAMGGGGALAAVSTSAAAAAADLPGAKEAGEVLAGALLELERLHVNASCRVRQRAPAGLHSLPGVRFVTWTHRLLAVIT
jgi:hypothetical protein